MAWPIGALRPLSGSSSAMRYLPEAVVVGPPGGVVGAGGGPDALGWGASAGAQQQRDGGER